MSDFNTNEYFQSLSKVMANLDCTQIDVAVNLILKHSTQNAKILTCGNGGSAYAASHYITDWNKMVNLSTGNKFRGISLCDNYGLITAYANDVSFDDVFSGQIKSIGDKGDLLIVVSGSGNSSNVIGAIDTANGMGITTLAFVGYDGGECKQRADYCVHVPSFDMQFCEDIHLMLGHIIMKKLCNYSIIS